MFDIVSIGDLLIDFTCVGESEQGMLLFERNPGGSSMNVAAQTNSLGGNAAVISTVGRDEHGEFLIDLVRDMGINVDNLQVTDAMGTRLMFVYLDEDNDRTFSPYKGTRSDLQTQADLLDYSQIENCKVFCYTPLSYSKGLPVFEASRRLLEVANKNNVLLAFDPNYRFPYTDRELRQMVTDAIMGSHILKLTEQELSYFVDGMDILSGTERLINGGAKLVAISMGKEGCFLRNQNGYAYSPTFKVDTKDTTGAGDSFMGALIYAATRAGVDIDALNKAELLEMVKFCNASAALCTTKRGSLLVMPTLAEVEKLLAEGELYPPVM